MISATKSLSNVKATTVTLDSTCDHKRSPGHSVSHSAQLTFSESGLTAIRLPASINVICKSCFSEWASLAMRLFRKWFELDSDSGVG
jgi:hypothetical protein